MDIKIINKSPNALPSKGSQWAAGLDVRAHLDKPVQIAPFSTRAIPTGLYTEVPNGFCNRDNATFRHGTNRGCERSQLARLN